MEVEAEGPVAAVEALTAWCRRGPPAARVTSVEVREVEAGAPENGFEVRY